MNDDNAAFFAVADILEFLHIPAIKDVTFIGANRVNAAQYFHQGRFTGPVFAAKGVDFTTFHFQADIVQRLHPRKGFGDIAHFQDGIHPVLPLPMFSQRRYSRSQSCLTVTVSFRQHRKRRASISERARPLSHSDQRITGLRPWCSNPNPPGFLPSWIYQP